MSTRAPGSESDYSHNVVGLSADHLAVPARERAERTSDPRLRIAILAPPWIATPPAGYGGIEFVVALLCDALLFVARMVEEKGPHRAIQVARATHSPLVLAGPVQPAHERFFANEVQPHIGGQQTRYGRRRSC